MRQVIFFLIGTMAAAAALASGQANEPAEIEVLPAESVIDQPLDITEAFDNGARLAVTTSIPMACVLVYGETPEFGNLALDSLMGANAHQEHEIILTGLAPDTEYFYRVQGSDEAGNLYASEIYTFRTLPEGDETSANLLSPENGAELIGYSSVFGGGAVDSQWGALNALDDDPLTQWSTAGDGDDAWIEVALAQRSRITGVMFWTRTMSNNTAQTYSFTVTTETGEVYGPFELPDAEQSYTFEVEIIAERLRFDVESSSGGNTGAVDIAVYGEAVE